MTKVFIAPGDSYHAAINMFEKAGYTVVKDYEEVDLVCFLGGTDVDPLIYGAERHPKTQSPDHARDLIEVALYKKFIDTPKVGICRGGQLLNVLNGGKMIQHLGKCVSGDVEMIIPEDAESFDTMTVRVDHHQGIRPAEHAVWISHLSGLTYNQMHLNARMPWYACAYPDTKSLCFQPHPEWGHKGTEDYFFELIERYFGFARKDTKCAA